MTDEEIAKLRALCEAARLEEDTEEKSGEDFDTIARVVWSDAAEAALPAALDEIERLRSELHAPLKDWRPDMKRWLADVLLKEASTVDGDAPETP